MRLAMDKAKPIRKLKQTFDGRLREVAPESLPLDIESLTS